MRKILFLTVLALLPLSQAWAGSDYFANLTVNKEGSGKGKVYIDSEERNYLVKSSNSSSSPVNISFNIKVEAEAGSQFAGWTAGEGVTLSSTALAQTTATISSSNTTTPGVAGKVTATFNEITYSPFQVTYSAPVNGSYTVDGVTVGAGGLVSEKKTKVYQPMLIATAASGYAFNGWYEGTTKKSASPTYTPAFTAATTVKADFVAAVSVTTYDDLVNSLKNNTCTEIPLGTEIIIESGKTLSVPSGKTLIVNGKLYVVGKLSNSGTISGGGAVVKITKTITQTGNGDGSPITTDCVDASKNKKYYKTTIAVNSATVPTSMSATQMNGAIVMRGGSRVAQCAWPTTASPAALSCTIDSTKAVNHITGFNDSCYYTSLAHALKAVKGDTTTKMLLLMSSKSADHDTCVDAGLTYTTADGKYTKLQANLGVMDLMGYTLTVSPKYIETYTHIALNGKLSVTTLMYWGTVTCINCDVDVQQVKNEYSSVVNVYDCKPSAFIKKYYDSSTTANSVNIYSSASDKDYYSTTNFLSRSSAYHIYGGRWNPEPKADFIASNLKSDYAFAKHADGYWYLKTKQDSTVAELNGVKFNSLDEAKTALAEAYKTTNAVMMVMSKNAALSSAIIVPKDKTLEIELNGCCITAQNGFVVNNGTLIIGDSIGNLASTGGRVETTNGNLIENNGEVHITYGYYTGNMVLNGGTFTTHHGYFTGAISGNAAYANLKGGYFSQNVTAFLKSGYYQRGGYVGPMPIPVVTKSYVSSNGGYWKYNIKLLSDKDSTIYCNAAASKFGYSVADWRRRGEIQSMVKPYYGYTIDTAVSFDRNVASNSATANITKPSKVGANALNKDVVAGELYRLLSEQLAHPTVSILQPSSQVTYQMALVDSTYKEMEVGVYSSASDNQGTTIDMRFDLCQGADGTDISKLTSVYALMAEYTVIGAQATSTTKMRAMIQPASGKATFYATVAEAIKACQKDGTIKLCNDITSTDTITVSKACTIDVNGMVFKGSFAAGAGLKMSVTESTPEVERYLGKNHKVYTFTKEEAPNPFNFSIAWGKSASYR